MAIKSFYIETYGCQMNEAESASLARILKSHGWKETQNHESAEVVILNTCSVRETAENRLWGRLGYYKHEKSRKDFKLVVMGCMAQRLKEKLIEKAPHIDIVVGNFEKQKIPIYLDDAFMHNSRFVATEENDFEFFHNHFNDSFKSFVPIMHGCNNFCSYCIVPFVRGREVSRDPVDIIEEVKTLVDLGVLEITLLGQNVNSYRYVRDGNTVRFTEIMEMVADIIPEDRWIRFLTSHPKDLSERAIEIIKERKQFCKHIHLPVQHGSNSVLKAMNRGYTKEYYIDLVKRIRDRIRDVAITTDILIGFPGETVDDVEETLDLMEKADFDDSFIYRYNPREGTLAYRWGDKISYEEKIERMNKVFAVQKRLSHLNRTKRIGERVKVLAEGVSKKNEREILGRTEWNEMVVFADSEESIGKFVVVELEKVSGNTYIGRRI